MSFRYLIFCFLLLAVSCRQEPPTEKQPRLIPKAVMCAPVTSDRAWYDGDNVAPLFEGLGDLHFPVSTDNELVQRYIDQGLTLAYGFNHAEAARSFYYATKLDPSCAMAHWGYAYVLGPNYNGGMEDDNYERAYAAIQEALAVSAEATTDKEKGLIAALAKRYTAEPVENRGPLDAAYAEAMGELYTRYPEDADIGAMYAESMMNLHPWDLFDKQGQPKAWTPEILSVLEGVLAQHPTHCGAHHFYIHAVEASATPEQGLASAQAFDEGLVPQAGHLVHMPSHIYIRTGDYHRGTLSNLRAIDVDSAYVASCNAQGAYPLAYFPHNQHFMAATATLEGNSKWALYAADALADNTNRQLMQEPGWGTLQHYYTIPFYVYAKFGKWDELLALQNEVPELDYPTAMLHYAHGLAYLRKGNTASAEKELAALSELARNEDLKDLTIWEINTVYDLVQIAEKVLRAELLAAAKDYPASIALFKEAIAIEDRLNYNEPPDWFFSVRHHLGAVQLAAGQYTDAVTTYQEDLALLPKNGWALHGLLEAYRQLDDAPNLAATEAALTQAWATADVTLKASVIE